MGKIPSGGRGGSNQYASLDTEISLEPTPQGFSCRIQSNETYQSMINLSTLKTRKSNLRIKRKKFSLIYIEEGQPCDPSHTPAHNRVMDIVREHKEMEINCYNKNIEEMAKMSQPQVSAVLKKLKKRKDKNRI